MKDVATTGGWGINVTIDYTSVLLLPSNQRASYWSYTLQKVYKMTKITSNETSYNLQEFLCLWVNWWIHLWILDACNLQHILRRNCWDSFFCFLGMHDSCIQRPTLFTRSRVPSLWSLSVRSCKVIVTYISSLLFIDLEFTNHNNVDANWTVHIMT